jgi:hypothetical protein
MQGNTDSVLLTTPAAFEQMVRGFREHLTFKGTFCGFQVYVDDRMQEDEWYTVNNGGRIYEDHKER